MKIFKIKLIFLILPFFLSTCAKVPITGRRQLDLIPAAEMQSLSFTSYKDFMSSAKISKDAKNTEMVKRVGAKVKVAVEQYLTTHNYAKRLKGFEWEFNLVDDPTINAWCMPGGKVVVYTGILPVVQSEAGLATVLGHEIAHAIAEHGGERMSQGLVTQFGGLALQVALSSKPQQTQALYLQAFNAGSQVAVILPYSRLHESEADHMGLIFMAMAGYNPEESVYFWERMKGQSGKSKSDIFSTHPSDDKRIAQIKSWLPEANKYYKK